MKTFFLTFILIITLNSCSNDNSSAPFVPVTITPVLIGKGYFGSGENFTPENLVISNQVDWNTFLTQINVNINYSSTFSETNINFTNFKIIAIIDSQRGHTGHSINIDTVIENLDNITVNYSLLNSGDGYTTMIQPYHIIRIPRINKPVIFQ